MDLEQLLASGMQMPAPGQDIPTMDTAETIQISSLALIKMLKHGRAGVPMEVMGLMLGEFIDEFSVRVVDVFAMPQSGTGVSVEAVDPVFQTKMLDMLKQTGRAEMVVGWYHSHPGFGPWLSSVDVNTQMSFEALNKRAVAVVIDPIQSVKGKVVIDAFRTIPSQAMLTQQEPRQCTSNIGHLHKPSIVALIHGLNRHYYSMPIGYRKGELEQRMLMNVNRQAWTGALELKNFATHALNNQLAATSILSLAEAYSKSLADELTKASQKQPPSSSDKDTAADDPKIRHVGKQDPKRHLKDRAGKVFTTNIVQLVGSMINQQVF